MPVFRINDRTVFFAHVPRTGGTSIERFLKRYGPHGFIMNNNALLRCSAQHWHREFYNKLFPSAFWDHSFSVVRNPFDRAVSLYKFRVAHVGNPPPFPEIMEYMIRRARRNITYNSNHMRPQIDFIADGMKVFRFERGIPEIVNELKVDFGIQDVSDSVPHRQKSGMEWPIRVDEPSIRCIQEWYKPDFRHFGYSDDPTEFLAKPSIVLSPSRRLHAVRWLLWPGVHYGVRKLKRRVSGSSRQGSRSAADLQL